MLTEEEYFGQSEFYFSESQQEQVDVATMVPQYALNAFLKLAEEHGDAFLGSVLAEALLMRVTPPVSKLRATLKQYGSAIVYIGPGGMLSNTARNRLRRAGAHTTHREGEWMKGFLPSGVQIKLHAR